MIDVFDDEELHGTVELEAETVKLLIRGASELYWPAFPFEDERKDIIEATDRAEEKLNAQQMNIESETDQ